MTGIVEIIDAVAKLASERLPELKQIHVGLTPADFERPALLIENIVNDIRPATLRTVEVTANLTLTLFDRVDDYAQSDGARLLRRQEELIGLFRSGCLPVGGRSLTAQASSGGRDWDEAYVNLQFAYFDDRKDGREAEPLMENIETDMTVKG